MAGVRQLPEQVVQGGALVVPAAPVDPAPPWATHSLPWGTWPDTQEKTHAPWAEQAETPLAGGTQGEHDDDRKQPVSGVLPTQAPLHRWFGATHPGGLPPVFPVFPVFPTLPLPPAPGAPPAPGPPPAPGEPPAPPGLRQAPAVQVSPSLQVSLG